MSPYLSEFLERGSQPKMVVLNDALPDKLGEIDFFEGTVSLPLDNEWWFSLAAPEGLLRVLKRGEYTRFKAKLGRIYSAGNLSAEAEKFGLGFDPKVGYFRRAA